MNAFLRLDEPSPHQKDWGIAVLRVVVGFAFLMHGWQKIFEYGLAGVTSTFGQMGVPLPELTAPLVAILELVGGAALLLGLGARWLAALLAIDMLAAILLVHLPGGFFAPAGVELPFLLLGGTVALALGGPGAFALDRLASRSRERALLTR
jgi:putative oxidoreductase